MKRLLIGDSRENLLSTIETLLRHWGYRVSASSRPEQLKAFLDESPPDLIVFGSDMISRPELETPVRSRLAVSECPLILLGDGVDAPKTDLPHDLLGGPLDIFSLFALIQKYMEKFPRKNLRLATQLPGMLCRGETSQLTEVLSLSVQGLFIKTGCRLEKGDTLKVIFPLMGMKKELELESRVLYRVHPDPENNYLQGLGIEFLDLGDEDRTTLESFLENRFLGEVSARQFGNSLLVPDQLQSRSPLTLRLI